jgi:hypothetical protein
LSKAKYDKENLAVEGVNWVMCPHCGSKIMRASFADGSEPCEVCSKMIAICSINDFVATWKCDKNDVSSNAERLEMYSRQFSKIAELAKLQVC